MAGYFLDSSAVGKLYHNELGAPEVRRLRVLPEARLYISRLGVIEMHSVFAGKVRTGAISADDAQALRNRSLGDLKARALRVTAIANAHYEQAERLIQRYGISLSLRTLDSLQLSVALDLGERGLVDLFVSSDKALCKVAVQAGLQVFDPEQP